MNSVLAQYPEFVKSSVLDMLVGPKEHHKAMFQSVLKVISGTLSQNIEWIDRVSEMQSFLNAQPKDALLSIESCNKGAKIRYIPDTYRPSTLFLLTWDNSVFCGPETILLESYHGFKIETYGYFTPTDAERVVIQQEYAASIAAEDPPYYSRFDDVFRHNTLPEFFEAMREENERYRYGVERERQFLAIA